jgi:hypothetical protein
MTSYAEGILSDVTIGPAIVEYLERINAVHERERNPATDVLHRERPNSTPRER